MAPSAPGNPVVSGTPTTTTASFTWTSSVTTGVPAETYTLFCMPSTATACDISKKVGTSSAVDVERAVKNGTVSALTAGTTYKCCVQAKNTVGSIYNPILTSTTTVGKLPQSFFLNFKSKSLNFLLSRLTFMIV